MCILDLPLPPAHLMEQYHDLDLSEEFLSQVLKYVDDLCNFINNGDSNLERTMEINQNISTAVGFYRNKLHAIDSKPDNDFGAPLDDFHHDHDDFENDLNGDSHVDDKNFEVIPKKVKQKRRKKLKGSVSLVMESYAQGSNLF
jgi:hypothetical protein